MTPAALARLNKALDFVLAELAKDTGAGSIITALERDHGAIARGFEPHRLRCAGVQGTCTWSATDGLLAAWRKNALVKIATEMAR